MSKKIIKDDKIDKYKKQQEEKNKIDLRIREAKDLNKIKISELTSDIRYLETKGFIKKLINRFKKAQNYIQCVVYMNNRNDIIKYFPLVRRNIIDINNKYYIFSMDSFRYINGTPTLYFFDENPFAVLFTPKDKEISLDASSFTEVQKSKFVQDVVRGQKDSASSSALIIIGVAMLSLLLGIANLVILLNVYKGMKG